MVLVYLIYLSIYGLIILGLVVFLRKRGVAEKIVVFAGFALFGILSGFLAALYGHMEGQYMLNILGVPLSEEIYGYAIDRYGDPSSAFAHYTIPWVLRIPQLAFFTSAIIWGLLGLPAQLIYNLVKKPPVKKGISMLVMGVSLIALLGVAVGVIYVKQVVTQDVIPTQPVAHQGKEGSIPTPNWETITTYELESLSLDRIVTKIGQPLRVTVMVKNIGSIKGRAVVEIKVDDEVLNSNDVALQPGESGQVLFFVIFPVEGVYTVSVGHLSQTIEVFAS